MNHYFAIKSTCHQIYTLQTQLFPLVTTKCVVQVVIFQHFNHLIWLHVGFNTFSIQSIDFLRKIVFSLIFYIELFKACSALRPIDVFVSFFFICKIFSLNYFVIVIKYGMKEVFCNFSSRPCHLLKDSHFSLLLVTFQCSRNFFRANIWEEKKRRGDATFFTTLSEMAIILKLINQHSR